MPLIRISKPFFSCIEDKEAMFLSGVFSGDTVELEIVFCCLLQHCVAIFASTNDKVMLHGTICKNDF